MEIRILSAGKEIGPYSEAQVRQYLSEGLISPTDLAVYGDLPAQQPISRLLAELSSPEMTLGAAGSADTRPISVRAGSPQRTKRGPIMMQPIFAGGEAESSRRPRTGKTALTIEAPRPTTQLPPVAKFVSNERKPSRTTVNTEQLAPENFFERAAIESASLAPTAPPTPLEETFAPDETQPAPEPDIAPAEAGTGEHEGWPPLIIYAGLVTGLIALGVIFALVYLLWHFNTPAPRGAASASPSSSGIQADSANAGPAPRTAAEFSARGIAREARGDLDGAMADYDHALEIDPQNADILYRRALARQTKGNGAGALADYNLLLTLQPNNADAFSNRGYVKQAQGDLDGALADYSEALLRNPKIAKAFYNIGLIKVRRRDLDGGIDAYNRALTLDPALTRAYYNRGNAKSAEGNVDGAIADYTQALALDPTLAMAYFGRAFARQSKGDTKGALADYSLALTHDPGIGAAYYNRGQIEVQSGDFQPAVLDSTRAIELDPQNAQAFCNRGLAEVGQGNLPNAEADLEKYCEMAPRDPGADLARLYLWLARAQQNARDKADAALATALQNDWNSPPEDLTSKIANFLLGHIRETELVADAASPDVSREPGQYCKVWYFAGMKRLLAGDAATALAYLQKSVATGQKDFCEYLFARAELVSLGPTRQASSQGALSPAPQ